MNLKTIIICVISAMVITSGIFYVAMLDRRDVTKTTVPNEQQVTEGSFVPLDLSVTTPEEGGTSSPQCQVCSKISDTGSRDQCLADFSC